ncbi:MAG TPA: hypothetical protein VMH04_01050 [Candidatus Solibacter sp.]|nr:hypothetical protein [Candidatus Solibacter sp.]
MRLILIAIVSLSSAAIALRASGSAFAFQDAPAPATSPGSATPQQQTQAPAPTAAAPSTPPQSPSTKPTAQKPTAAKRPVRKKPRNPKCDPAPAGTSSTTSATSPNSTSSKNCPPSKIIVRQGGTSEPSIQLAGGASGDQANGQRDATNQLLGSTDANLKKLEGRSLSANQQDMVSQVRQFMQQSKTAVDAGDMERARTLAWKAQLLSEELLKPAK